MGPRPPSPYSKWHFNRFGHFVEFAVLNNKHTHRHTHKPHYICRNRLHLCTTHCVHVIQPKNKKNNCTNIVTHRTVTRHFSHNKLTIFSTGMLDSTSNNPAKPTFCNNIGKSYIINASNKGAMLCCNSCGFHRVFRCPSCYPTNSAKGLNGTSNLEVQSLPFWARMQHHKI